MKRSRAVWGTSLGITLAVVGCVSSPEPGNADWAAWATQDATQWQLRDTSAIHRQDTLATTLAEGAERAIPAEAGAQDYVRLALTNNPSILAAEAKVTRLQARIPQVTSLDDPMLKVSPVGDMAETAAGEVGMMTGLSQKLPFPGKLQTRGRIAGQAVAMAQEELTRVRLGVAADTRDAYWSYYFVTRAIEVTQQSRDLLSQFRQVAEAKYKANLATQQDVLRASVELSNLDNELITLGQRRSTTVAMLNSLLDRPVTAPLPSPAVARLDRVRLDLDALLAQAAAANPDLAKIKARIEAERQRLKLAQLQRWPDLTLGLSYNPVDSDGLAPMANGKDQWWLSFGVNLPIWLDKLSAGEREARMGMLEAVARLTRVRDRVAFRVQDAAVKVDTQQRLVVLFRDVILPQAGQTVDASGSGYRAGKVDFLTLVDNWRKLLNFQILYHQSLSQLEKDFARLQEAVGRDLPRPVGPTSRPAASTQPEE